MGTGCESVARVHTPGTDLVTGVWKGGRVGTFRGLRAGSKLRFRTDVVAVDPFVTVAASRAPFRANDLLELAQPIHCLSVKGGSNVQI